MSATTASDFMDNDEFLINVHIVQKPTTVNRNRRFKESNDLFKIISTFPPTTSLQHISTSAFNLGRNAIQQGDTEETGAQLTAAVQTNASTILSSSTATRQALTSNVIFDQEGKGSSSNSTSSIGNASEEAGGRTMLGKSSLSNIMEIDFDFDDNDDPDRDLLI